MPHECTLEEQGAQPALSIRTRTPLEGLPQAVGLAYATIARYLGELREQRAGAPFVAYHNMDMQDLDVEIGFPVRKKLPPRKTIRSTQIPAGTYATCLHIGPYTGLHEAYEALRAWMQENGHQASGLVYEMCLNDPMQVTPEELETQIAFLLR